MGGDCFSQAWGSALEARAYFLLLRQKKVAKEKATPGSASGYARSLALLDGPGGWLNSPSAQTTPADCPRPASVAQRLSRGPKDVPAQPARQKIACCGRRLRMGKNQIRCDTGSARVGYPGPLRGAEQRRLARIKGEHCLRAKPELRSPRASRVAQGTGVAGTDPGVAFSLATFFWPPKRKYARQQGGTPCQLKQPA